MIWTSSLMAVAPVEAMVATCDFWESGNWRSAAALPQATSAASSPRIAEQTGWAEARPISGSKSRAGWG